MVTALLWASRPSTAAMWATAGPTFLNPSSVRLCTVIFFWKVSRDTPLYILAYPYLQQAPILRLLQAGSLASKLARSMRTCFAQGSEQ